MKRSWIPWILSPLLALAALWLAATTLAPQPVVMSIRTETIQWDARLTQLKAGILPAACYDKPHFEIVEAWITVNGNWDDPLIPSFAKVRQRDYLGGDHHAWGLALDSYGNTYIQPGWLLSWPDGKQGAVGEPGNGQWANAELYAGFDPKTTGGPYTWQKGTSSVAPCGAETLTGLGMPYTIPWLTGDVAAAGGHHVAYFGVWQLVEAQPTPVPPTATPVPMPTPQPLSGAYWLRIGPFRIAVELEARE